MPTSYVIRFDPERCVGIVDNEKQVSDLVNRWYGKKTGSSLVLEMVEIAYLLLKGRAEIENDERISTLEGFMDKYYSCLKEFFWPRLVVYRDLRDRGRRVRVISDKEFLVRDKHGELRLVVVLEEGSRIPVEHIPGLLEKAIDNGLKLVFAIVSLQGDLTYYEVTGINPVNEV